MAKKPSTKKTFKSLFSKSEANLSETVEEKSVVEKNATDKKKFKFSVLKVKSKSSAASEKPAPESQQVLRYVAHKYYLSAASAQRVSA